MAPYGGITRSGYSQVMDTFGKTNTDTTPILYVTATGSHCDKPRIEPKKGRAGFAKFFAKDVKRRVQ